MLVMYATNAKIKGWWNEVNLIIWGASSKLAGNDLQVQAAISEMISHGVHVEACKKCSDNFGVSETLVNLGIDVRYMGEPFTNYLKSGEKVLTI